MMEIENYCCPRCHSALMWVDESTIACSCIDCRYNSAETFPIVGGQPALVDFERSLVRKSQLIATDGASTVSRKRSRLFHLLRKLVKGEEATTTANAKDFVSMIVSRASGQHPTVLVIGGGTVRSGASKLYGRDDLRLRAFDVYASPLTEFVGDGHQIPLPDQSVEGVWIEAVLEHVLEPHVVVSEIYRVLKPGGLVYAETPFMQQVHEGPYDFTRFTHSGHRWLFRRFDEIRSGTSAGAGTSLIWAIRYFWYSLTGSKTVATVLSLPMFWLRFLDRAANSKAAIDAGSGFFFLGSKSESEMPLGDIVDYYKGNQ